MFDSIFSGGVTVLLVLLMFALSCLFGLILAVIYSLRMRSSKGYFIVIALLPALVSLTFVFLNVMVTKDTTSLIAPIGTVMIGMGLIRFRSQQGRADEMLALFNAITVGLICGLGYVLYAFIASIILPLIYVLLVSLPIFNNKMLKREQLLKITIPESLEYNDCFADTFNHYLKENEMVEVKTTGMGSMFRLSYRIIMKNRSEEKEFIDELRTKNGNLEISILPYTEKTNSL